MQPCLFYPCLQTTWYIRYALDFWRHVRAGAKHVYFMQRYLFQHAAKGLGKRGRSLTLFRSLFGIIFFHSLSGNHCVTSRSLFRLVWQERVHTRITQMTHMPSTKPFCLLCQHQGSLRHRCMICLSKSTQILNSIRKMVRKTRNRSEKRPETSPKLESPSLIVSKYLTSTSLKFFAPSTNLHDYQVGHSDNLQGWPRYA